jgi:tRNA (guanine37-N1)-methyltransferase
MTNTTPLFTANIITLFPEMFPGPLNHSLAGRSLKNKIWSLATLNPRDFATDKHKTVDAPAYGGGPGMILKADILQKAINKAQEKQKGYLIYLSPRGKRLNQDMVQDYLKHGSITLICGRYEGIDQRVIEHNNVEELSIGDYILSGGELAALVFLDACVRLLPGVMGDDQSGLDESFVSGLLEYPHYTRPEVWNGLKVPEVLLSGHHKKIDDWRKEQSVQLTKKIRPDLWDMYQKNK